MGKNVVNLIYAWGAFTEADSINTNLALLHYSYGLIGFAAVRVAVPFYYAFGDSKLPMKASVIAVMVNMALYYPLIQILDFAGLAAATSIAGLLNFGILLYFLPSRGVIYSPGRLGLNVLRVGSASLLAFYVARMVPVGFYTGGNEILERLEALLLPSAVAAMIYLLLCVIMGVKEVSLVVQKLIGRTTKDR
jgi:putative peptidoglycan lipid II flippase